ncbi:sigma factor [Dehalobacter sp. TeCB1]|nr:sigma factor [Dehalobacter sp. TeCB1]
MYKEYASLAYKVINRILKDEYLAQDAVQEAFVNISNLKTRNKAKEKLD